MSPARSSERSYTGGRTRTMGDFAVGGTTPANGHGPRSDWIDYRASIARVHRRDQAGDEALTCQHCGTETDVTDVVHSPQCPVVQAARPRAAGDWTATQALTAAEHWAETYGGPPTQPDWAKANNEHPSYAICVQLFGSWKEMLRQAGWQPASGRRPAQRIRPVEESEPLKAQTTGRELAEPDVMEEVDAGASAPAHVDGANTSRKPTPAGYWTRERIIAAIQAFAAEHGRPPGANDWPHADPELKRPTTDAVMKVFGKWSEGIRAAGFEPRRRGRTVVLPEEDSSSERAASESPARGHARPVVDRGLDDQQPPLGARSVAATDRTGEPEPGPAPDAGEAPPGFARALIAAGRAFFDTLERELADG